MSEQNEREPEVKDGKLSIYSHQPFIDLNLYQYGYEQCTPLHSYGPAIRNHYLFHYVMSGEGELRASGSDGKDRTHHLKEGEGFLIFPGQITTYTASQENPWKYVWLEFDGLIVKEAIMDSGITWENPVFRPDNQEVSDNIRSTLLDLLEFEDVSPYKMISQLYLLMDQLTIASGKDFTYTGERMSDFYIREVSHYIEQHFAEDITVENMARHLNLSRGYLNKIFKKQTGKTPKEFLTSYRMAKATQLLKTTQMPIGEVGNAVGYSNQLHFSRAFKNHFGSSPKMWRQQNK